jgi:hypothetical protein
MLPRPDLGLGLFDFPSINGPYLERDPDWRPLATIYGPLYGCELDQCEGFDDRIEVYFRERSSGGLEYEAHWVRD